MKRSTIILTLTWIIIFNVASIYLAFTTDNYNLLWKSTIIGITLIVDVFLWFCIVSTVINEYWRMKNAGVYKREK